MFQIFLTLEIFLLVQNIYSIIPKKITRKFEHLLGSRILDPVFCDALQEVHPFFPKNGQLKIAGIYNSDKWATNYEKNGQKCLPENGQLKTASNLFH